jgi:hypothetical protein
MKVIGIIGSGKVGSSIIKKVMVSEEVSIKQLTIDKLRVQFEMFSKTRTCNHDMTLDTMGEYRNPNREVAWQYYKQSAIFNKIIKGS